MPNAPIDDLPARIAAIDTLNDADFERIAAQSILALEARQIGTNQGYEVFPVFGFDDEFFRATPYSLAIRARGYESDADVWRALEEDASLAVITHYAVPARDSLVALAGGLPDFRLEGFYIEDADFEAVDVELRDPQTGRTTTVTVVGVLPVLSPDQFLTGLVTGDTAMRGAFGDHARASAYWVTLGDDADPDSIKADLESAFFAHGLQVDIMQEVVDEVVSGQRTFTYLVQGFLGLGLVVGVAGLAVISARSVVERRRDLAVLRSIGFQRWMVYLLVLTETSFVALTGIVVGFLLGIVIAYNITTELGSQPAFPGVAFAVPWVNLLLIFFVVYAAAILTSLLPARRAANVYPAEALRYD